MKLYILEIIVATILAIILTIILKVKKNKKIGLALGTLTGIFIIVFGTTFILEKPTVNITEQQLNLEVGQSTSDRKSVV